MDAQGFCLAPAGTLAADVPESSAASAAAAVAAVSAAANGGAASGYAVAAGGGMGSGSAAGAGSAANSAGAAGAAAGAAGVVGSATNGASGSAASAVGGGASASGAGGSTDGPPAPAPDDWPMRLLQEFERQTRLQLPRNNCGFRPAPAGGGQQVGKVVTLPAIVLGSAFDGPERRFTGWGRSKLVRRLFAFCYYTHTKPRACGYLLVFYVSGFDARYGG